MTRSSRAEFTTVEEFALFPASRARDGLVELSFYVLSLWTR